MIRKARIEDVRPIHALLNRFADRGLLLGRSLSSLYDQIRDFHVAVEEEGAGERLIGVCALHFCWEDLAEVRSLAVTEDRHGQGIGRQLVTAILAEALTFGIHRVFTLTYQPGFFRKLGFRDIDKKELPHKVWSDCIQCPKFPDCTEEALLWEWGATKESP
ncbi:MAG: N-acetyltransferase [Thermodesulfobacteriota bacterium]